MNDITWKSAVLQLAIEFCQQQQARTFRLGELWEFGAPRLAVQFPSNNNASAKLRQTLQYLRDEQLIHFVDGRGTYTLCGVDLLDYETAQPTLVNALQKSAPQEPQTREYWREVYARDYALVRQAKEIYGTRCLCRDCQNSFFKADGSRYCEVHHIRPLFQGGEDVLSNLAVVCAHHHKMAHFATSEESAALNTDLAQIAREILARVSP